MEIIVGKYSGFCGGVLNSVNKAKEILNEKEKCYALGELVHNEQVIDELESLGMITIDSLDQVENGSEVIIRAHGVSKDVYKEANKREITLYDLTCPKVLKIHDLARDNENRFVIIIGKSTHPEIIGTKSFCDKYEVVENNEELNKTINYILENNIDNITVITQTTFNEDKYMEMISIIKDELKDKDLNIYNNICKATELRQNETKELANKVDLMIIIGGKNSSNTKKLYDISSIITKTYLIETYKDLKDLDINYNKIGIMGGASTPKKSIDDVIRYLKNE